MPTLNLQKSRKFKASRKKLLLSLLGGVCVVCEGTDSLEFDHVNPWDMEFRIGHRLDYSMERLLNELSKCQLLCKSCHVRKTHVDNNHNIGIVHGTYTTYANYKCRCDKCREANTEHQRPYLRGYRARRRAMKVV